MMLCSFLLVDLSINEREIIGVYVSCLKIHLFVKMASFHFTHVCLLLTLLLRMFVCISVNDIIPVVQLQFI